MEARPRSMENKPPNLHEHLTWEILLRLPVKSLVRFKCVSKSWLSIISDVNFAKLHYDLTASHTPQLVFSVSIVDSNKAQIRSIDPEGSLELVDCVNFVSPFQSQLEANYVHILGVCRGFILLGHDTDLDKWAYPSWPHENLLVWNPATGIHRTLSYSEIGSKLRCLTDHCMRASYILEYDALTDDYFVVITWIKGYCCIDCNNCIDGFELFSMRTNSWKQFDPIKDYRGPRCCRAPLHFLSVSGAIFWLTTTTVDDSFKVIGSFDFTERSYSEIPLPDDGLVNDCILRLEAIGGCLCLMCFPRQPPRFAMVWMMKEYKVNSCWTKCSYVPQHTTPFLHPHDATPLHDFYFSPIYFTRAGRIIGYSNIGLAKLNDKGELLHHQGAVDQECYIYTESLLSLPIDSGQALEDDKR